MEVLHNKDRTFFSLIPFYNIAMLHDMWRTSPQISCLGVPFHNQSRLAHATVRKMEQGQKTHDTTCHLIIFTALPSSLLSPLPSNNRSFFTGILFSFPITPCRQNLPRRNNFILHETLHRKKLRGIISDFAHDSFDDVDKRLCFRPWKLKSCLIMYLTVNYKGTLKLK